MNVSERGAFPSPESDSMVCFNHGKLFPCRRCTEVWHREEYEFRRTIWTAIALIVAGFAFIAWLIWTASSL